MYSLIIVDDEVLIRSSLTRTIDWGKLGIHVSATFSNGKDVIAYMEENETDIVISDIKMPLMDGIDTLRFIHDTRPQVKVILLTGYAEFDYIKQAMEYGVFDYLLKPVKREEMEQAMRRCIDAIEKEKNFFMLLRKKKEADRQELLVRCLMGTTRPEERAELFGQMRSYGLIVLLYDFTESQTVAKRRYFERVERVVRDLLAEKIRQASKLDVVLAVLESDIQCLLLISQEERDVLDTVAMRVWTEILYRRLSEENRQDEVVITVSYMACADKDDRIAGYYQETLNTLKLRHILGNNRILESNGSTEMREEIKVLSYPSEEILEEIRYGQTDMVERNIRDIYDRFFDGREYASLMAVRNFSLELVIIIFSLNKSGSEQTSFLYFLNDLQRLNTVEELRDRVLQLALTVARGNAGKYQRSQVILAEKAQEYMQKEYARQDLGLETVSRELHVSATYLSIVLKRVTGRNFSTHLLEVRMERAKKLLMEEHYKLQKVAEAVGYSSSQYFSVCFKKYTGMTPSQFREKANRTL